MTEGLDGGECDSVFNSSGSHWRVKVVSSSKYGDCCAEYNFLLLWECVDVDIL